MYFQVLQSSTIALRVNKDGEIFRAGKEREQCSENEVYFTRDFTILSKRD